MALVFLAAASACQKPSDGGGAAAQPSATPRCGRHEGPDGITTVTCDATGRVTAVTSPDGATKTYKY
jgi:YD repeat-containing protein